MAIDGHAESARRQIRAKTGDPVSCLRRECAGNARAGQPNDERSGHANRLANKIIGSKCTVTNFMISFFFYFLA